MSVSLPNLRRGIEIAVRKQGRRLVPKRDGLFDRLDAAALAAAVRASVPALTSAFVVGSAINRPHNLVQDIDITAFDPEMRADEDRSCTFEFSGLPVHVVSYHPSYFDAMAGDRVLALLFLREIRKLRRGVMLFDLDGHGAALLNRMSRVEVPLDLLDQQYLVINSGKVPLPSPGQTNEVASACILRQRLNLYHLVENAVFYLLHLDAGSTYSKPKWIMLDVAHAASPAMVRLVDAISAEYCSAGIVPEAANLAQAVAKQIAGASGLPLQLHGHAVAMAGDAAQLVRNSDHAAASWSLRMALLMVARCVSMIEGIPYEDCRSLEQLLPVLSPRYSDLKRLARMSMLADTPLPLSFAQLWEDARNDLSFRRDAAMNAHLTGRGAQSCGASTRFTIV